jgi:4-hydroxy-tetrahydrodipicolinate synthase
MTKLNKSDFQGTGVAIVTPFHREGNIDFKTFERLVNYQIEGGIDYIVFLGTTGESVTLNDDEKAAVIHCGLEIVDNRVPVIVGIGGNNTNHILHQIKHTDFTGISAILSVSPYYNKPQPKGIYNHFKAIASETPVPVIIYNVPSRTGSNMDSEIVLKLAHEVPNICGIKEASGNLGQCARIINERPDNFRVISGDDALTLPLMSLGGDGVISVIANALPEEFSQMVDYCLQNDYDNARKMHYKLIKIIEAIYADGSPSGIKALLEIRGLAKNNVRMPLAKVNKSIYNLLATLNENF